MGLFVLRFNNGTKKVPIENPTFQGILDVFKDAFAFTGNTNSLIVKLYDPDLKDIDPDPFIDINDSTQLPSSGSIKFLVPEKTTVTASCSRNVSDTPDMLIDESTDQDEAPANPTNGQQASANQFIFGTGKPFPLNYSIPSFVPNLHLAARQHVAGTPVDAQVRRDILDTLAKNAVVYGSGYPSSSQFVIILSKLIFKYRNLSDVPLQARDPIQECCFASWRKDLSQKIRNLRRKPFTPTDFQKTMQDKHRRKSLLPAGTPRVETEQAMRNNLRFMNMHVATTEDPRSVAHHKKTLKDAWAKKLLFVVNDCLERLKGDRKELYDRPIQELMKEYPMMAHSEELIEDCKRMLNINLQCAREEFFTERRITELSRYLKNYRSAAKILNALDENSDSADFQSAIMYLIPLALGETLKTWVVVNDNVNTNKPSIRVTVGDPPDSSVLNPEMIDIFIDKKVVVSVNCEKLCHGMDAYFAAVLLFNYRYPIGLTKTCNFIADVVYQIPRQRGKMYCNSVQTLINIAKPTNL